MDGYTVLVIIYLKLLFGSQRMGIDWTAFIRIYSSNESDVDKLYDNFSKYCKQAFQKDEGWVQRTPNTIRYSFSPHTVGLSASRIMGTDFMDLYLLDCIVRDFPSCYVKGFWYADSGYTHEYIAYWDSAEKCVINKYLGYECVDEDFYRHIPYRIHVNPCFKPNKTALYEVDFRIESYHGSLNIEEIRKCFPLEKIKQHGFHSDYIHVFYSTNKIDFELFYSILRKTSCSYLKVDWERIDKTLAGIWVGHNKNGDITHHSISFLPEPQEVYIDEAPKKEEFEYNIYELINKEDEEEIQENLIGDEYSQIMIDDGAQWAEWFCMEKVDDILEDIRFQYRCHSIWHTLDEPKDIFYIPSPIGGFWYLKHKNGDVFHSEDEGIVEYLKLLSEHNVYKEIENQEKEDLLAFADKVTHESIVLNQDPNILWWSKETEDYIYWTDREFEYVSLEVEHHDVWKDVEREEFEDLLAFAEQEYHNEDLYEINTGWADGKRMDKLEEIYLLESDPNILCWWNEEQDYIYWIERDIEFVSPEVEQHDVWKDVEQEEQEDIPYINLKSHSRKK